MRVIVGVDGSPQSLQALQWACQRAEMCRDQVRAVCTWSLGDSGADWEPVAGAKAEEQRRAERVLRDLAEPVRLDHPAIELETAALPGPAAQVLVDLSADADLLVVGSRGLGGFAGLLLGSVSTHCVHHAHCPVTVVRRVN